MKHLNHLFGKTALSPGHYKNIQMYAFYGITILAAKLIGSMVFCFLYYIINLKH